MKNVQGSSAGAGKLTFIFSALHSIVKGAHQVHFKQVLVNSMFINKVDEGNTND